VGNSENSSTPIVILNRIQAVAPNERALALLAPPSRTVALKGWASRQKVQKAQEPLVSHRLRMSGYSVTEEGIRSHGLEFGNSRVGYPIHRMRPSLTSDSAPRCDVSSVRWGDDDAKAFVRHLARGTAEGQ
jgi:hypothetical protein